MNLNTFARHGVFKDSEVTRIIAKRLRDRASVLRARAFPYQLLCAYQMAGEEIPKLVKAALQDALEISIENVPAIEGMVYVCPDVSGSMESPVTGFRKGSTSKVRCIDVAALMAAAVLRKNPDAEVIPFSDKVVSLTLNPRDSVLTNAEKLASLLSGGTCCSAPLRMLNRKKANGVMVIMISDNQSWLETAAGKGKTTTATMAEWQEFKYRNQESKFVCIDLQPYGSTQAQERMDIMNIGGFSDQVFKIISLFAKGELGADYWMKCINAVDL
jgi:60 kDa SS-A/Ro ribonucleoprotein